MSTRITTSPAAATCVPEARRSDTVAIATRRGMTMVEILFSVLIIFLIMALLIGAVRLVTRSARETAHQTAVLSLKQGVSQFQQEFGFYPPLVRDTINTVSPGNPPGYNFSGDPVPGPPRVIRTFTIGDHGAFLRYLPPADQPDYRFSIYSLPYYLIGVLDQERGGAGADAQHPIDGLAGPGFRTPKRDGSFDNTGRTYLPFFSVGSGSTTLYTPDERQWGGRVELRDTNGVAFRYYRWEPLAQTDPPAASRDPEAFRRHLAAPRILGDVITNPDLRRARYAIVGAGPNGLFGDEHLLDGNHPQHSTIAEMRIRLGLGSTVPDPEVVAAAMADNVVEVGQ